MKKQIKMLLTLLLALAMCFSLLACGADNDDDDDDRGSENHSSSNKDEDGEDNNGENKEDEPQETRPSFPEIDMDGINAFKNGVEFSFVRAYHSTEVKSPNPEGRGISFPAPEGKVVMVLHLDVTNTTDEAMSLSDLFGVYFIFGEDDGTGTFAAAVEPEENKLDRSYVINPGETALVYYMVRWADTYDLSDVTVSIENGEDVYQSKVDFSQEFAYQIEAPKFAKGDTITCDYRGSFTVTVDDIYMADTFYPPQATGNYTYLSDDPATQYLILKLNVKNLDSKNLSYQNIAGVHCMHNDTDKYESSGLAEENGGQDLNPGAVGMLLAPQEENVIYFVMMIPNEAVNDSLEINMYVGNELYICNFTA